MALMKTLNGYEICDEVARATATNAESIASGNHTHAISDVDGLQTALNGKASSSHTHTSLAFKGNVSATQDWNTLADGIWIVGQSQAFSATYNQPVGAYSYGMLRVFSNGNSITQTYIAHQDGQMWFRQRFSSSNNFTAWARTYTTVSKPTVSEIGAAASSHNHSAANITSGTLPVARGGTGVTWSDPVVASGTSNNWYYVKFASGIAICFGNIKFTFGSIGANSAGWSDYIPLPFTLMANTKVHVSMPSVYSHMIYRGAESTYDKVRVGMKTFSESQKGSYTYPTIVCGRWK